MTNSDKQNNLFCTCAIAKALDTKSDITQTSKETNWWSFDESLAWCLKTLLIFSKYFSSNNYFSPGRVAQSVTCLATDASLTADPGFASLIPARSHTFVELDHEIFYGHSPPIRWIIQEGLLSVTSESMCTTYWFTACSSLPRKKV